MINQAFTRRLTGRECSEMLPPVALLRNALLQQGLQRKVDQLINPNTPNFYGSTVVCLVDAVFENSHAQEIRVFEGAIYVVTSCSFGELMNILKKEDRVIIHESTAPMNEKGTVNQLKNAGYGLTYLSKAWNETGFYVIENTSRTSYE